VQRYLLLKVVASRPKSVITQAQASDQWAYYQAKGIKSYIYQLQVDKLALEVEVLQSENQKLSSIYSDKIKDYKKKIEKYEQEKSQAQTKAKQLEAQRDEAQIHSKAFGMAVIYLQIAILLSSIAGL
jgi:predicted RNase H-like nuclease (RuvC/YqgF family)